MSEMVLWRTIALVLTGVLAGVLLCVAYAVIRPKLIEIHSPQRQHLIEREDETDLSDNISDTSSLFSPPCRAGVDFKSAAANVSETRCYITPSVSHEDFGKLWEMEDDDDSPKARV